MTTIFGRRVFVRALVRRCVMGALVALSMAAVAAAQPDAGWAPVAAFPAGLEANGPGPRPQLFQPLVLNGAALEALLLTAPMEDTPGAAKMIRVPIPMPDGTMSEFDVVESPIMEPGLQAALPSTRTYKGWGVDDPTAVMRLMISPEGCSVMVRSAAGAVFIDPYVKGDGIHHVSYRLSDFGPAINWVCDTKGEPREIPVDPEAGTALNRSGPTRRNYRLAVAATGEYTSVYGSAAAAQNNIVSVINRINLVYETEVAVRFTLVANNLSLIFTSSGTDPYTNNVNSEMLDQNQTTVDSIIGSANYDIGHVFGTAGGGVAQLGSVCGSGSKARGVSSSAGTINNPYTLYVVAHEIGHQFNAPHSFNGIGGSCGGNRSGSGAIEPGSGSTIMSYAGNCGADNIASSSDLFFHSGSFDRILLFLPGAACSTSTATGNLAPVVNAGGDFTIPARTPFVLTGSATDANGDAMTYSWEQRDQGAALALASGDNGTSPIIRAYPPQATPIRTVPRLGDLLNNSTPLGEILPTTSRFLNFRLTARDNKAGGGGVNTDDMRITVAGSAGPFQVTSHNTSGTYRGAQTVTWDVAGTSISPISAPNVRILLSSDGGTTFPVVLTASTPNTGTANVIFPSITTNVGRIRIEPTNNIFFDVNNINLFIRPPTTPVIFNSAGAAATDTAGNGNANGVIDPGENQIGLTLGITNTGASTATGISATLTSLTPTVSVVTGVSAYANIAPAGGASNTTPFEIAIAPEHLCGETINLQLSVVSAQTSAVLLYTLQTGAAGGPPGAPVTFRYAGAPVNIPDNDSAGISVPINVAGVGTVHGVQASIDGSTCSTDPADTNVGLNHGNVGDLILSIIAPDATAVTMFNRHAAGGINFCNTIFDSTDPLLPPIQFATAGQAPFTDVWRPTNTTAVLLGKNADGQWFFRARDRAALATGTIRAVSIIITPQGRACASPVVACPWDYNADGNLNPDDVGDYITDYYMVPALHGPGGYAIACPDNEPPFDAGYRVDVTGDCIANPDDLGDYITAYYQGC
ncbi:MAG: reprolysin-like metallopeptidase [Phycisphaerales bacterium]